MNFTTSTATLLPAPAHIPRPRILRRATLAREEAGKPSMIVLPNGDILLSYIKGYNLVNNPPRNERTEVMRSSDGGRTWSQPVRATHSSENDREGYLIQFPDGTILLTFMRVMAHIEPERPWQGPFLCESTDGGRTWSEAWQVDISAFCPSGPYGASGRGHIVLPDGTLLLFVSTYEIPERPLEYVMVSHDKGRTFSEYHFISDFSGDSTYTRLPDGRIVGALRVNGADFPSRGANAELQNLSEAVHFMGITISEDEGQTWSLPQPATDYNEIPGHLLTLNDGRPLLTFGVRHNPIGVQAVLGNADATAPETWQRFLLVDDGAAFVLPHGSVRHAIGHPYTVQLHDGTLLTAFYRLADPADGASCTVEAVFWQLDF